MPPRRTLFVHIGTHGTGAAAVQRFLRSNAAVLASHGLHVPVAGTVDERGGHHNIAWQLIKDERFRPAHGTLGDLVLELAGAGHPCAIVSSEDLEHLVAQPGRIAEIEHAVNSGGWQVVYILFLLHQSSYVHSLHGELTANHGLRIPFSGFLDEIIAHGRFRTRGNWCFCFDYGHFIATWRAASTGDLRVIDYTRASADGGVLSPLLAATGVIGPDRLLAGCADAGGANVGARPAPACPGWLQASRAAREHFAEVNARLGRTYGIELAEERSPRRT